MIRVKANEFFFSKIIIAVIVLNGVFLCSKIVISLFIMNGCILLIANACLSMYSHILYIILSYRCTKLIYLFDVKMNKD